MGGLPTSGTLRFLRYALIALTLAVTCAERQRSAVKARQQSVNPPIQRPSVVDTIADGRRAALDSVRTGSESAEDREQAIIGQILELNRRLQRERQAAWLDRLWVQQRAPRVIVVANRLPFKIERGENGEFTYTISAGGMVSALLGVQHMRMIWVGWAALDDTTPEEREAIRRILWRRGCVPVFLPREQASLYYNGYCNDVLWPLFHYVISRVREADEAPAAGPIGGGHERAQWSAYRAVNEEFARVVSTITSGGDMVWVHDYHLMLLPALLRAAQPKLKIGWFLHTPWPALEVFRTLPNRREILYGLLAADLLGFHIYEYARHFLHACTHLLGNEVSLDARKLNWEMPLPPAAGGGKLQQAVRVDAFPIGIDPQRFQRALELPQVKDRIIELQRQFGGARVMLGVDRMDYIKGIPHKLLAMESLLAAHPQHVGKVVLLQIAVPTRTEVPEYQKLRADAHRLVGRINGRFGSPGYAPVHYLDTSVSFEELVALYAFASACVVTSLRDGMNLVSYEYVACQASAHGVLVLSEFAGAAQALGAGCVRVNPYDTEDIARGMHEALTMAPDERELLHKYALQYVFKHTAQAWAQGFAAQLQRGPDSPALQTAYAQPLPERALLDEYAAAERRLLILGVGGLLLPPAAEDAEANARGLSDAQRRLMRKLVADPRNTLLLASARSCARMGTLLSQIERPEAAAGLEEAETEAAKEGRTLQPMGGAVDATVWEGEPFAAMAAASGVETIRRISDSAGAAEVGTYDGVTDGHRNVPLEATTPNEQPSSRARVWALAESGVFARHSNGRWETTLQAAKDAGWIESVVKVFAYYAERTPRSWVERNDRTIRWMYGAALPELGAEHASNLVEVLEKVLRNAPVEILWDAIRVEVRPYGSSCGHGLVQLLNKERAQDSVAAAAAAAEPPASSTAPESAATRAATATAGVDGILPPSEGASAAAEATGGGVEADGGSSFDFVLCLGNFSARDEDVFTKLHSAEQQAGAGVDPLGDDGLEDELEAELDGEFPAELEDWEARELEVKVAAARDRPLPQGVDDTRLSQQLASPVLDTASWKLTAPREPALLETQLAVAGDGRLPVLRADGQPSSRLAIGPQRAGRRRLSARHAALPEAEVPSLVLGVAVERGAALYVRSGGCFTTTLGNHSTHARYFLPNQEAATALLEKLAALPAASRAVRRASRPVIDAAARAPLSHDDYLPNALERGALDTIQERLSQCWTPAFCLDYDGTLAPLVADPDAARLPKGVGRLLHQLTDRHPVSIVSGRSIEKLRRWVQVKGLYFAGSHGFEIAGPDGSSLNYSIASQLLPEIRTALTALQGLLAQVPGVMIEDNKFTLSVHTRNVSADDMPRVNAFVDQVLDEQPLLRRSPGHEVIELRPQVHWHKGRAMEWLIKSMCEQLGLPGDGAARNATAMPIFIGDDVTDEDAFVLLRGGRGIPIVVRPQAPMRSSTAAEFWLRDPQQVAEFLSMFLHSERSWPSIHD